MDGNLENGGSAPSITPAARRRRRGPNTPLVLGEVAHKHEMENEDYNLENKPCHVVEYKVRTKGGLTINQKHFAGTVIVSQCVADYLTSMDLQHEKNEAAIHNNLGRKIDLGEIRG